MNEEIIEALLESFDYCDGRYKRREVELAVTLREQIVPRLISVLEDVAADPAPYADGERDLHLYAAALLSYFQEPEAHLPIIAAFTISDEYLEDVWGDLTTNSLPTFLFQTCNGSFAAIKELALNTSADDYVRCSAAEALTYAVARGAVESEEVERFLASLLRVEIAGERGPLWDIVISALAGIYAEGALDVIKKAFAEGHAWAGFASLEDIEAEFSRDKEEVLERLRERVDRYIPTDVHDYLSWIDDKEELPSSIGANTPKAEKKKKQATRTKSKQAKKSKRKNRK